MSLRDIYHAYGRSPEGMTVGRQNPPTYVGGFFLDQYVYYFYFSSRTVKMLLHF